MSQPSSPDGLRFASALCTFPDVKKAAKQVCREGIEQLQRPVDLAFVFVSSGRIDDFPSIAADIRDSLQTENVIGCSADSLIGVGAEIEHEPAISLWLASLPGADITFMHLQYEKSPEGGAIVGWPEELNQPWPEDTSIILLGDPFQFPADAMLEQLNEDRPGAFVIGGMASGASSPGENRLLLGSKVFTEGATAVVFRGGVRVRSVVSQGCRPIGKPFVITKSEQNIIHSLGGEAALLKLKEVFDALPTHEQQMVQKGLHLGRVVSEYQDHFEQGDFLIRNVLGMDPDSGSITVGDYIRPGQTVQFHLRDAQTADDELSNMLAKLKENPAVNPQGALLFSCNGRGSPFFGEPHHDALALQKAFGDLPLAGFFAAGEIGPVGGKNFMHGYTASFALFESIQHPRSPPSFY